jgi:hypothetical protein
MSPFDQKDSIARPDFLKNLQAYLLPRPRTFNGNTVYLHRPYRLAHVGFWALDQNRIPHMERFFQLYHSGVHLGKIMGDGPSQNSFNNGLFYSCFPRAYLLFPDPRRGLPLAWHPWNDTFFSGFQAAAPGGLMLFTKGFFEESPKAF